MHGRGLLVLALLVAGCAGPPPPPAEATAPPRTTEPAQASVPLLIYVVDREYLPLEGAHVEVLELGANLTTDASGGADFGPVPPGAYRAIAHRDGFAVNRTLVEVDAEAEAAPMVVLSPAPHDHFAVYFGIGEGGCSAFSIEGVVLDEECRDELSPSLHPYVRFRLRPNLYQADATIYWDPPTATGAQRLRFELHVLDGDQRRLPFPSGSAPEAEGSSPVVVELAHDRLDPELVDQARYLEVAVYPPRQGPRPPLLSQSFDVTVAVVERIPPD
jgi:hypothetical protein